MLITYLLAVRNTNATTGDNRITGLTPTWVFFQKTSDSSRQTPPIITEIGYGQYLFKFDSLTNGECNGQIDFGASVPNAYDRYVDIYLVQDSPRVMSFLDASVSSRQPASFAPSNQSEKEDTPDGYSPGVDPAEYTRPAAG